MFDYSKREEYLANINCLPTLEAIYFINKIVLLEKIFSVYGVEKIEYDGDFSVSNMGDSYHFMPSVDFDISLNITGSNIDNSFLLCGFRQEMTRLDEQIYEHICENNVGTSKDSIDSAISEQLESFLLYGNLDKQNRFETYREEAANHFSKEAYSFFEEYIDALKNNQLYSSPVKEAYGIEFDIIPLAEDAFTKQLQIMSSQRLFNQNLFYLSLDNYLSDLLLKENLNFETGMIAISTNRDADISFKYFDSQDDHDKTFTAHIDKPVNYLDLCALDINKINGSESRTLKDVGNVYQNIMWASNIFGIGFSHIKQDEVLNKSKEIIKKFHQKKIEHEKSSLEKSIIQTKSSDETMLKSRL